ncbi:MAG: hypothetical protein KJP25_06480 [Gammaproteobacteria bacterium]|nr:hypothetical protein [Gammaproteobacteria bacterium]MBT8150561.1 hypothetical protein [Gammaproteobacteria bacterium]NND38339.1 hypothetical protein [Pseudomonadales bacterium]NNM12329.1 hypothetical protein [Pseudomonadales bacterium]RZV60163.1 MAG: hypothetical protein EX270_00385 [Pseudomonadales bacterium]
MSDTPSIRKTDAPFNDPVQTSRFVDISGQWYFMTREHQLQGPFAVRAAAEMALQIYLQESASSAKAHSPKTQAPESPLYPAGSYLVSDGEKPAINNVVDWHSAKANLLG